MPWERYQRALPESVPPATKAISRMSYLDVSPDPESIKIGLGVLRNGRYHHCWFNPTTNPPSPTERSMGAFRRSVRPAGHHLHAFLAMDNLRWQSLIHRQNFKEAANCRKSIPALMPCADCACSGRCTENINCTCLSLTNSRDAEQPQQHNCINGSQCVAVVLSASTHPLNS